MRNEVVIDVVFLGQTVPERRKKDPSIVQVCSAGYSPTLRQLVRIYPLPVRFGGHRWHKFYIPVERNPKDSRIESFKVASPERKNNLDKVIDDLDFSEKIDREELFPVLEKLAAPSIDYLNKERRSLGIIKPSSINGFWVANEEHNELFERTDLFQQRDISKKGFAQWARVQFSDEDGQRNLMLNSWDVYEWHRKFSNDYPLSDVFDRLCFGKENYKHLFLVGNMSSFRNRWLIIAVLGLPQKEKRKKTESQLQLFCNEKGD